MPSLPNCKLYAIDNTSFYINPEKKKWDMRNIQEIFIEWIEFGLPFKIVTVTWSRATRALQVHSSWGLCDRHWPSSRSSRSPTFERCQKTILVKASRRPWFFPDHPWQWQQKHFPRESWAKNDFWHRSPLTPCLMTVPKPLCSLSL